MGYKCTIICDAPWAWENIKSKVIDEHIIGTQTGTSLSFNTSYVGKMDLSINGNTNQTVTQSSKNLLPLKSGTISANGVTCTIASDGTITLDGTATTGTSIEITPLLSTTLVANTIPIIQMTSGSYYTISKTVVSGTKSANESCAAYDTTGSFSTGSRLFDITENPVTITAGTAFSSGYSTSLNVGLFRIYVNPGNSFQQYTCRAQFELGQSATSWVPFVPQSPSPDYPAPISGVTYIEKWSGMTADNRNLFNPIVGTIMSNGITCTIATDGTITLNGTPTAQFQLQIPFVNTFKVIANTDYTHSVSYNSPTSYLVSPTIALANGVRQSAFSINSLPSGINVLSKTTQISNNIIADHYDIYFARTTDTFSNFSLKIQFEQGSTATAWKPAPEDLPSYQKIVLPQALYTSDTYDVIRGHGTVQKKEIVFDGSPDEIWTLQSGGATGCVRFSISVADLLVNSYLNVSFSNFATKTGDTDGTGGNWYQNYIFLTIFQARLSGWSDSWTSAQKVTAFKTWLASNPVTVLYQLATPATITGTPISLMTDSGTNTITNDGNGQMTVSWYNSIATPFSFDFINNSDDEDIMRPKLQFICGSTGGDISITNITNNNNIISFTGLSANEIITIDEFGQLSSSTGENRYNNWNKNRLYMLFGKNQINVTGNITSISITYQNARRVGY